MDVCPDAFQPFRMAIVWPVIVGCVAFLSVRALVFFVDGAMAHWQATLALVVGIAAAIVASSIARWWNGSADYWLAFTVGLAFAAVVLLLNVVIVVNRSVSDHDG